MQGSRSRNRFISLTLIAFLLLGACPKGKPVFAAPLLDAGPFGCPETGGALDKTWQNTATDLEFTISGFTVNGYLAYFGSDSNGQSLSPTFMDSTYSAAGVVSASGKYYLNLAQAEDPNTWWTCFEYWYDNNSPDIQNAYASAPGITSGEWQNSVTNPTFTLHISDGESGLDSYQLYWGPDSNGEALDTYPSSQTTFSPGSLADGDYYLRALGVDQLGNTSGWNTLFNFRLDTAPPEDVVYPAVTVPPSNEADWHSDRTPEFDWVDVAGAAEYSLYWGPLADGEIETDSSPSSTFTAAELPATGIYYLRAKANDAAGNLSPNWVTLYTYKLDMEGPNPVLSVTETGGLVNGQCQNISRDADFTWIDPGSTDAEVVGYDYYWGPNPNGTNSGFVADPALNAVSLPKGGKYYLRLSSRDSAGNNSAWNTVFIICHGDNVRRVTHTNGTVMGLYVPEPYDAVFSFLEDAYHEDYYVRIWYPSDHSAPPFSPAPPRWHQSFQVAFDQANDLADIGSLEVSATLQISYPDDDILAIKEETLKIYRFDGSEWKVIQNSVVDVENNLVTAEIAAPGEYILMGDAVPENERLSILVTPIQFGNIVLTGQKQIILCNPTPWTVLDARYSDPGWHVTISATDFTDGQGHVIPNSNVSIEVEMDDISIKAGTGQPQPASNEAITLDEGGQVFIFAENGSSTGKFTVRPHFTLEIPADAYVGTYNNNITITIISGPN